MKRWIIMAALLIAPSIMLTVPTLPLGKESKQSAAGLDTNAIEREIEKKGEMKGDVYKISLPRTDLDVSIQEVSLKPGFALGSWIAFKAAGRETVTHGDLVLTQEEVFPVVRELEAQGLQITALHNHLIGESPHVMYLHFWGRGDAQKLAHGLKEALRKTKTPIGESKKAETPGQEPALDSQLIQSKLGQKGDLKDGVLKISVPRSEKIAEGGVELPPTMGMATAINFQAAGTGQVAATGDFVLTEKEVNQVARTLEEKGITVTALHNHLLHGSPQVYFMHFWAQGPAAQVAEGLKAGLDAMKRE